VKEPDHVSLGVVPGSRGSWRRFQFDHAPLPLEIVGRLVGERHVAVPVGRVVGDFRWFGAFKRMKGTAFAWWDTWLFVPLCLLLALGCLIVAVSED
jgi:uncharacterized protein DUF3995